MARIDTSRIRLASAALLALGLTMTSAQARGFGGGFHGGYAPRVGAWGRPLGPVRPGVAIGGGFARPGYAVRPPHLHHHWHRGYRGYGYGLGGLGLGLGLGGWVWDYGPSWYDDFVYVPPVVVPPTEVTVETEVVTDDSAAVAACARRFKTYDPATQTYIGKGYVRRRCP